MANGALLNSSVGVHLKAAEDAATATNKYEGTMTANSGATATSLGNGNWNVKGATMSPGANAKDAFRFYLTEPSLDKSTIRFQATVNSGSFVIASYYDGSHAIPLPQGAHVIVDGLNIVKVGPVTQDSIILYQSALDVQAYDIDFRNIKIKAT